MKIVNQFMNLILLPFLFIILFDQMDALNIPVIEVMEETRAGSVLVDKLEHRFPPVYNLDNNNINNNKPPYVAIGNPSSPGINQLEIRANRFDGSLELAVKPDQTGPDREQLCANHKLQTSNQIINHCDITLIILYGKREDPTYGKLTLRILDRNDNSPQFAKQEAIELRIPENIDESFDSNQIDQSQIVLSQRKQSNHGRLPITLELPIAHDADLAENGIKTYRLLTMSGHEADKSLFNLIVDSESGGDKSLGNSVLKPSLRIIGILDREKQNEHWFHLLAIDGGNPTLTGTQTIHLVITDLNDNVPRFRKPIYHFSSLVTSTELYNQNGDQEILKIPETAPIGSSILTLIADDPDEDLNGQITYRLKQSVGVDQNSVALQWFGLDTQNGTAVLKIVQSLDADSPHHTRWSNMNTDYSGRLVKLVIEALDAGSPSLTGTSEITILVENVNDNPPLISIQYTQPYQTVTNHKQTLVGSLQENQKSTTTVAHITVEDGDLLQISDSGALSLMTETYCETNDTRFHLEKLSNINNPERGENYDVSASQLGTSLQFYKLSAVKPIDRESEPWIYIMITCVDQVQTNYALNQLYQNLNHLNQPNRLTGSTVVTIKMFDMNDNIPRFTQPQYRFSTFETPSLKGSLLKEVYVTEQEKAEIGQVKAIDLDEGVNGQVTYSLLNNLNDIFYIDPISGILKRVGYLDREKLSQVELIVEARDQGNISHSGTAVIKIDILDVNDNTPYWVIPNTSPNDEFNIQRAGVEDGVYYFSINEDATVGHTIGHISAIDTDDMTKSEADTKLLSITTSDSGRTAIDRNIGGIMYKLEMDGDAKIFSIHPRTGELRLSQHLDREMRAHYEFRAFAIDNINFNAKATKQNSFLINKWKHQYTATATIIITVLDINDNAPIFETPLNGQEFHIDPGSALVTAGTTLFTAKAHDPDMGDNSQIQYSLDNGGYGIVEIDATTGVCYLRETIQYSLLAKLIASNHLPMISRTESNTFESNSQSTIHSVTNQAHELHSFNLGLTIIARDMGKPLSLNSSRTVKLVWTTETQIKTFRPNNLNGINSAMNSFGAISGFLTDTRLSADKLLIILTIGAFILLIIISVILFGVIRCRKYPKITQTNLFNKCQNKTFPHSNTNSNQQTNWWFCPIRKQSKLTHVEDIKKSIQILDRSEQDSGFIVNQYGEFATKLNDDKLLNKNRHNQAEMSMKSCLPDCVPSVTADNFNLNPNRLNDKSRIKWNALHSYSPQDFNRKANKTLQRTMSDESVNNYRQLDVGYTALCAYPNPFSNETRFIPLNMESASQQQTDKSGQLQFTLQGTNSKYKQSANHYQTECNMFYSPLGVHYGAQNITYPRSIAPAAAAATITTTTNTMHIPPSSYDLGGQTVDDTWIDKYEDLETDKELVTFNKSIGDNPLPPPPPHYHHHHHQQQQQQQTLNWKPKLADAYAENSFV